MRYIDIAFSYVYRTHLLTLHAILPSYIHTYYVDMYVGSYSMYVHSYVYAVNECVNILPVVGFFALVCSYAPVMICSLAEPDQCNVARNV